MTDASDVSLRDKQIFMAHGAGGEASRRLVEGLFRPHFSNPALDALSDAAIVPGLRERLAMTVDSFVVQPLEFSGGSIGELAVNGTVNDLAVSGARPLAIAAAFILEAGLAADVLRRETRAMADAARRAGVPVITGDTKVVEHGKADGMYITTSGVGLIDSRADLSLSRVVAGDRILVSGPLGSHGMAIMLARAELQIEADIHSDTRSVLPFTSALLDAVGGRVRWMRDATRGGAATVLNELARDAGVVVSLDERAIPVADEVRDACELLGIDPLHVANEGQFVAVVSADSADAALAAVRGVPGGEQACLVGDVAAGPAPRVLARSAFGGVRIIDMLIGDPLPRIC